MAEKSTPNPMRKLDRKYAATTLKGIHRNYGQLKGNKKVEAQICFIFDTTGSMAAYFEAVKQQLGKFVTDLLLDLPQLQIALMAHGDYGDEDSSYIINSVNFSNDVEHLLDWISKVGPSGGGDFPECYELALFEARKTLSWSTDDTVTRAVVMVGDAPPHGANEHEKIDWKEEVQALKQDGVRIYGIRCGHSHESFYQSIANLSNGHLIEFSDTQMMTELFMELCYREVQFRAEKLTTHEELSVALKTPEDRKKALINTVSACLLGEPVFYSEVASAIQLKIESLAESITTNDQNPEFLLQLAAYVRNVVYIRATANFLLALAISKPDCKEFVEKYFNLIVKLPSDLAQVMQYHLKRNKSIPSFLRRCVQSKFLEFDEYSLAKHDKAGNQKKAEKNKEKRRAKNVEKGKKRAKEEGRPVREPTQKNPVEGDDLTPKPVKREKALGLKQIIRLCHITEPVNIVMSIVGKKYPSNVEEFNKSGLKGEFQPERAGKRMKLQVPLTWETELAAKGNKPEVWEDLLSQKKLPFMAMLRNLRNFLVTGVKEDTHRTVLNRLKNEKQVENSKQFPFRFLSAFQAISFTDEQINQINGKENENPAPAAPARRGGAVAKPPLKKRPPPINPLEREMINEYEVALNESLRISIAKNVAHLDGSALLLCDVSGSMTYNPSKTIKGVYSSAKTSADIGLLMASMIQAVSQSAELVVFSSPNGSPGFVKVQPEASILKTWEALKIAAEGLGKETKFPYKILDEAIKNKTKYDYIFVISDMIIAPHKIHPAGSKISAKIQEYREEVNAEAQFICVDLFGHGSSSAGLNEDLEGNVHPKDLLITGYSDQILSYIGSRNQPDAQLKHVEGIYDELKKNGKEEVKE
eukprot:TRINITY_DN2003_c0_g1_i1.p1 TRINITY_DN2003_c0_g1~~TRINITY_DN2003_c0_g1_i1.p1  ORF type:complete len:869 (-),score=338.75 TRINITY_DN2003_c0_g1_i1:41-2647(-)